MIRILYIFILLTLVSCTRSGQDFGAVKQGMTKNEVIAAAGQPSKKSNIGIAELWTYSANDRTVVFRKDTVYQIMTSAEARTDSLKVDVKEAGSKIKDKLNNFGDTLSKVGDSTKKKLRNFGDSTKKKLD